MILEEKSPPDSNGECQNCCDDSMGLSEKVIWVCREGGTWEKKKNNRSLIIRKTLNYLETDKNT